MGVTEVRHLIRHWRLLSSAVPPDPSCPPAAPPSAQDASPASVGPSERSETSGDTSLGGSEDRS